MTEKINVVIDRAKWRTGRDSVHATGKGTTRLLNLDGYMCCLGFCCQAAGVQNNDLRCMHTPSRLVNEQRINSFQLKGLAIKYGDGCDFYTNSPLTWSAMLINDCESTTPEEKEQEILELFKDSNFEIEFTGEYSQKGTENDN